MSAINTGSLNINYPIPGINNNTQGFRDNFSSIKTNIDTASSEITELQNKTILKQSLDNKFLDNDMNNTLISNALTLGFRSTTLNIGNDLSGFVDIDFSKADVHYGSITGNVTLRFGNWSKINTFSKLHVILNTPVPGTTITFPDSVNTSFLTIENRINSNTVLVPANLDYFHFTVSTQDCGETLTVTTENRPRRSTQFQTGAPTFNLISCSGSLAIIAGNIDVIGTNTHFSSELKVGKKIYDEQNNLIGIIKKIYSDTKLRLQTIPVTSSNLVSFKTQKFIGQIGDTLGTVVTDGTMLYICTGNHTGVDEIWENLNLNSLDVSESLTSIKVTGGNTGLTFSPDQEITSFGEFVLGGILKPNNGGTGKDLSDSTGVLHFENGIAVVKQVDLASSLITESLPISNGGTGADNQPDALKNLVPNIIGKFGNYLRTDGENIYWDNVNLELPIASSSTLGGVKVSSGLTINSSSGFLSLKPATNSNIGGVIVDGNTITVNSEGLISINPVVISNLTIPVAGYTPNGALGGVIVGSGLSITPSGVLSVNPTSLPIATSITPGIVRVGPTMIINNGILDVLNPELPPASEITYGAVKIDNKTIVINNNQQVSVSWQGLIEASGSTGFPFDGSDLPKATKETLGVVKIGNGLDINNDGVLSFTGSIDTSSAKRLEVGPGSNVYRTATVDIAGVGSANTIPCRDVNGNLNATLFQGTATRSNSLAVGDAFRISLVGTASTDWSVADNQNTIPCRDGSGNLNANRFQGLATSARYADLAENYLPDQEYPVGTVVSIGGVNEITQCDYGDRAIGAISDNPAYLMNSELTGGIPVALKGRVFIKIHGPISKGDKLVAYSNGTATNIENCPNKNYYNIFAIALANNSNASVKLVEALIL